MPATLASDLARYLDDNDRRFHDELFDFLRIPSVSARSEYDADMQRTAQWVSDNLRAAGLATEIMPTPGHPVVLGEWRGAPAGAPTVLVYGHYDVQPAEPLELWTTPPFEPTMRDGRIYARGSVDDKGQLFVHIKALETHLKARGKLPLNVIVLAEGEEEVGSDNLEAFVDGAREAARLRLLRHLRLVDVRAGAALDPLIAARPRVLPDRPRRGRRAICTRGAMAAPS